MDRILKIALFQGYHGKGVPDSAKREIKKSKSDILCLPEYFFVGSEESSILRSAERHDVHLHYLLELSVSLNCAIAGGTLLKRLNGEFKNRGYFINHGDIIGYYDKIHPYKNEGQGRVKPGSEYRVFDYDGLKIGMLICADVLHRASFYNIRGLNPDFLVVPVTSPSREGETVSEKYDRDEELWVKGARIAGCPIVKVGSVGKIAGRQLQGRSLAANGNGIIFRVLPEDETRPILKFLDVPL
jgi:predicted amidohydrolase